MRLNEILYEKLYTETVKPVRNLLVYGIWPGVRNCILLTNSGRGTFQPLPLIVCLRLDERRRLDQRGRSLGDDEEVDDEPDQLLEKMRKLYIKSYPLDKSGTKAIMPDPSSIPGVGGPITGPTSDKEKAAAATRRAKSKEKGEVPYSVFRLCATYEQFQKYSLSADNYLESFKLNDFRSLVVSALILWPFNFLHQIILKIT